MHIAPEKINLAQFTPDKIRNFSIIAHIDHGKSTLSDRLLEVTGTLSDRVKMNSSWTNSKLNVNAASPSKHKLLLCFMTIKGSTYLLNLIDTPGHVILVMKFPAHYMPAKEHYCWSMHRQGVEAQTMANFYLAFEQDLTIIPVINKIDMATADPERVADQMSKAYLILIRR